MRTMRYVRVDMTLQPVNALSSDEQVIEIDQPPIRVKGVALLQIDDHGSWVINWHASEDKFYTVYAAGTV